MFFQCPECKITKGSQHITEHVKTHKVTKNKADCRIDYNPDIHERCPWSACREPFRGRLSSIWNDLQKHIFESHIRKLELWDENMERYRQDPPNGGPGSDLGNASRPSGNFGSGEDAPASNGGYSYNYSLGPSQGPFLGGQYQFRCNGPSMRLEPERGRSLVRKPSRERPRSWQSLGRLPPVAAEATIRLDLIGVRIGLGSQQATRNRQKVMDDGDMPISGIKNAADDDSDSSTESQNPRASSPPEAPSTAATSLSSSLVLSPPTESKSQVAARMQGSVQQGMSQGGFTPVQSCTGTFTSLGACIDMSPRRSTGMTPTLEGQIRRALSSLDLGTAATFLGEVSSPSERMTLKRTISVGSVTIQGAAMASPPTTGQPMFELARAVLLLSRLYRGRGSGKLAAATGEHSAVKHGVALAVDRESLEDALTGYALTEIGTTPAIPGNDNKPSDDGI